MLSPATLTHKAEMISPESAACHARSGVPLSRILLIVPKLTARYGRSSPIPVYRGRLCFVFLPEDSGYLSFSLFFLT